LANALSVLRRCKASDYPFGIFKLLLAIALRSRTLKNRQHNGQK
jgi:hypothetical protein